MEGSGLTRTTSLRPTLKLLTFVKRRERRSSESLIFGAYKIVNACMSMDFINERTDRLNVKHRQMLEKWGNHFSHVKVCNKHCTLGGGAP